MGERDGNQYRASRENFQATTLEFISVCMSAGGNAVLSLPR